MSANRFYITTPIYYVNDRPHLGHAYTTVAADAMARYKRQRGFEVFFLTGTDEHGQKVAQAAARRGMPEQAHCDAMHQNFKNLWTRLHVSHDAFLRTTDPDHQRVVAEALRRLWDGGRIYKKDYEGWYNVSDEVFVADEAEIARLKAAGKVEYVKEANYFFRMSAYQDRLIAAIASGEMRILPESRRNEVLGFLRSRPLGDLSISRPKSRLRWGIELPFDSDHVCYVWVDALINYVSATQYLRKNDLGGWDNRFAPFWPADFHLIGKDILTTHAVYWTALLMALDLPLPKAVFSHGWWTFEGQKMSKSIGNVVDPNRLIDEFGADALRYFVLREMPFGLDGDFAAEALVKRINGDLANDLGNLASRVLNLVEKAGGRFPSGAETDISEEGRSLIRLLDTEAVPRFESEMEQLAFSRALEALWPILDRLNGWIQASAPWDLARRMADDAQAARRFADVVGVSGRILKGCAALLHPFLPTRMQTLWEALGGRGPLGEYRHPPGAGWALPISTEAPVVKGEALFPRLDPKTVVRFTERAQAMDNQGVPGTPQEAEITIDQFLGAELRVGEVMAAERVPKSRKLIKLEVAFGEEDGRPVRRPVVAGIGASYEPERLIGRQVVVVFNLAPARLMGIESQGMLLAAPTEDGGLEVATFEKKVKPGVRVK